jgi:hypothetical protein
MKAFLCSILSFVHSVLWKPSGFGSIQKKSILEVDKFQLEVYLAVPGSQIAEAEKKSG